MFKKGDILRRTRSRGDQMYRKRGYVFIVGKLEGSGGVWDEDNHFHADEYLESVSSLEMESEMLEDLQESIVKAGGRFFRRKELLGMTLSKLLTQFGPNGITFMYRRK